MPALSLFDGSGWPSDDDGEVEDGLLDDEDEDEDEEGETEVTEKDAEVLVCASAQNCSVSCSAEGSSSAQPEAIHDVRLEVNCELKTSTL